MGGLRLKIHPLFFLFGLYYALTGKIFTFLVYTLTATTHELGHSLVAGEKGYRLNKITLMPFGAVVSGDLDSLNLKDQISIALAGPLTNLIIALIFIASWWIYPESYPYTQSAVEANLSMALINCLPAYPLDGGRILFAFLALRLKEKTAALTCKILGVIFSTLILALFVISLFNAPNYSVLFFALFIFFGAICREKDTGYVRIFYNGVQRKLKKGVEIKRFAVDKSITVKGLVNLMEVNAINEIVFYENLRPVKVLSQADVQKIVENGDFNRPAYPQIIALKY